MITGGPRKARWRAFWHTMRRPGHVIGAFYVRGRLVAMHCQTCQRPFYGKVVAVAEVTEHWTVTPAPPESRV